MNQGPSISTELLQLCGKVRDQTMTAEDAARLDELLCSSDQAVQFYVLFMTTASLLESQDLSEQHTSSGETSAGLLFDLLQMERQAPSELAAMQLPEIDPPKPAAVASERRESEVSTKDIFSAAGFVLRNTLKRPGVVGALAAAALVLGLWLISPFGGAVDSTSTPDAGPSAVVTPVARVTALHDTRWAPASLAVRYRVGDELLPGDVLELRAGYAELTTRSGAIVILEGPCSVKMVDDDNALRLDAGKLVAHCQTDQSRGFVVRTRFADITDLSTEFGVDASEGHVVATVFKGEIKFEAEGVAPRHLTEKQTARLRIEGDRRELVVEDQLAEGFTERVPRGSLVTGARINLEGFEVRVVPNGCQEDAIHHIDRSHEVNGLDASGIPAALLGGDLVLTPSNARPQLKPGTEGMEIEIDVSRPADVYVLLPEHAEVGPWLERDYTLTLMRVGQDTGLTGLGVGPGVSIDDTLLVWKRKQPVGGTTVITGPIDGAMYSIVVKPSTDQKRLHD